MTICFVIIMQCFILKDVAHIVNFKYINSKIPNTRGQFRPDESECGVDLLRNRCSYSRTAETWILPKSWFGAQLFSIRIGIHPKTFPIDVPVCVDSKTVIRNVITRRNLEVTFKHMFGVCPPGGSFFPSEIELWTGLLHKWNLDKKFESGTEG